MVSKSGQNQGDLEGFSKGADVVSDDLENASKNPGFSLSNREAVGLGRGLNAFFESLPALDLELSELSELSERADRADFSPPKDDAKTPVFDANSPVSFSPRTGLTPRPRDTASARRSRSSLRLRYEAEVLTIKKKIGDLEYIRETLGLTQRKICQLLLVDPSAWTRWTKRGEDAPPHIYRALQWYLAIQDKYPALDVNFWLSTVSRVTNPDEIGIKRHEEKIASLESDFVDVNLEVGRLQKELRERSEEYARDRRDLQERLERALLAQTSPRTSLLRPGRGLSRELIAALLGALALGMLIATVFLK